VATTLEEARICPKCGTSGDLGAKMPSAKPGINVVVATCRNALCRWYETGWPIQINADGTIPDAAAPGQARGQKQFGNSLTTGVTNELIERVNRQAAQGDQGGELRR
jgi:hypothetical protein